MELVSHTSNRYRSRRTGYSEQSEQHGLSKVRQRTKFGTGVKDSVDQSQSTSNLRSKAPSTRSEESIIACARQKCRSQDDHSEDGYSLSNWKIKIGIVGARSISIITISCNFMLVAKNIIRIQLMSWILCATTVMQLLWPVLIWSFFSCSNYSPFSCIYSRTMRHALAASPPIPLSDMCIFKVNSERTSMQSSALSFSYSTLASLSSQTYQTQVPPEHHP